MKALNRKFRRALVSSRREGGGHERGGGTEIAARFSPHSGNLRSEADKHSRMEAHIKANSTLLGMRGITIGRKQPIIKRKSRIVISLVLATFALTFIQSAKADMVTAQSQFSVAETVLSVADVEQLYAAVNDAANEGAAITLAPGTYVPSPNNAAGVGGTQRRTAGTAMGHVAVRRHG